MKYDVTIEHENGRFLAVHAFEGRPDEMAEMRGGLTRRYVGPGPGTAVNPR